MGHNTGCFKFKYIHERESYEVLLAILKKRKKVSFAGVSSQQNTRDQDYNLPILMQRPDDDSEEIPVVQKTPKAKEIPFILSQESQYSLSTGSRYS